MEINVETTKDGLVVLVEGRLDAVTAPAFEKNLAEWIEKGETVLQLNLGKLEYISSAGLRGILSTAKRLKAKNGRMLFFGLQEPVRDVFRISGFDSIFQVFETAEEALQKR
ncbi:STAS domain-containing protein [Desulfatirhabdium butyrativorans]|uniref:STAS domain-containing protein n=1 Tax=Desulfatirhabdium butyrativorans TaxID=340467 RepID=UPI000410B275|nr:STAS domain-containing protein [Desulfatirhabdium butyrativorans]